MSDGDRVLAKDPDLLTNITQLSSTVKVIISFHEVLLSQLEERVGSWNVHTQLGKIFEEMVRASGMGVPEHLIHGV